MSNRRPALNLVVAALSLAGIAAAWLLPSPGWWPSGWSGPYPRIFVGLAVFATSGAFAAMVFAPASRSKRLLLVGLWLAASLSAAATYNETLYRAFVLHHQPATWTGPVYWSVMALWDVGVAILACGCGLTGSGLLRWLFPRLLRTVHLADWWGRKRFTVREFHSTDDVFAVATDWAQANGLESPTETDNERHYKSYLGATPNDLFVFHLAVAHYDGEVRIECGLAISAFPRLASLFTTPAVMALESGGMAAAMPRRKARVLANDLFVRLGVEPIA